LWISQKNLTRSSWYCYKLKTLELIKRKNLVLGLIQENSTENSVQDCLLYMLIPNSPCKLFLAYPKWPYVCLKINMYITHCITSSLPECSMSFHMLCDLSLPLSPYHLMLLMCDWVMLSLTLTLSSKNRIKENKSK